MKSLCDVPVIFVHYPQGAGGWFLSSLIYYTFNQTKQLIVDLNGSGHGNTSIEKSNNFYYNFSNTAQSKQINESQSVENFTREQRIECLQKELIVNEGFENDIHVISIHCKDINLYLEAFPKSKCVQITVDDQDLIICALNFIYKIVNLIDINFTNFSKEYGRNDQEILKDLELLRNPTNEIFSQLYWATEHIKKTAKNIDNQLEFENRTFEINLQNYLQDDIDNVLSEILNFCHGDTDFYKKLNSNLHDELYSSMLIYRSKQKRFLFER